MGGAEKLAKRKAEGRLNARERIDYLIGEGSFSESGMFAAGIRPEVRDKTPADGKIAGFARIDGREVALVSNDFTVLGASSSRHQHEEDPHVKQVAAKSRPAARPARRIDGARMPDRMGAAGRAIFAQDPTEYQRLRETPWVSALLGACYGSSTWYACDVRFRRDAQRRDHGGRKPARDVDGDQPPIDPKDLGGWKILTGIIGLADLAVDTDEQALAAIKRFLSYLPSQQNEAAAGGAGAAGSDDACQHMLELMPESRTKVYDVRKMIEAIADGESAFELKERFGRRLRPCSRASMADVGVHREQSAVQGRRDRRRRLPARSTSFMVLCDSFNIPLVFLVDHARIS